MFSLFNVTSNDMSITSSLFIAWNPFVFVEIATTIFI